MAGIKGVGGQNKKSRRMHIIDGTFRPDRRGDRCAAKAKPESPTGEVVCPSWLTAAERKVWDRLAPEMQRLNLLTPLDVPAFASLCVIYAELQWAAKQRGRWVKGSTGQLKMHPVNQYRLQLIEKLRVLTESFGATPASRARVEELLPLVEPAPTKPRPTRDGKPVTNRRGDPA